MKSFDTTQDWPEHVEGQNQLITVKPKARFDLQNAKFKIQNAKVKIP